MTSIPRHRRSVLAAVGVLVLAAAIWIVLSLPPDRAPQLASPPTAPAVAANAAAAPESPPLRQAIEATPQRPSLRGRIVDADGEPLPGALVGEVDSDRPVRTAADGRFEVRAAEGAGATITLLVIAPAHAARLSTHALADATTTDVGDVEVLPGGGLRGQVTDGAGAGLAGATVALRLLSGSSWPASIDLDALQPPLTTAAGGDFVATHLVPGSYVLTATAPGRQQARTGAVAVAEGRTVTLDPIALPVGFALQGVVRDGDDHAIAGAMVELRSGPGQPWFRDRATTGDDGRFAFPSLPAGPLRMQVHATGYLRAERADVDPTTGNELVVRLVAGLRLSGTVLDRDHGRPVERYAVAVRRIGDLAPLSNGTMRQQLERQLAALRAAAAAGGDGRAPALIDELERRLVDLAQQSRSRPAAAVELGAAAEHPGGAFVFEGLDEGLYTVVVEAPDHPRAESETVDLRRDAPAPSLRVIVAHGHDVTGVVVRARDGSPIAGAEVALVRVWDDGSAASDDLDAAVPSWALAASRTPGVTLATATTSADGRFTLRHAEPGRYVVTVDHPRFVHQETAEFDLHADRGALRVALGERATLTGHVRGRRDEAVQVVAVGGHGTLQKVAVDAGGGYRIERLPPGGYVVRAFLQSDEHYVARLLETLFPQRVGERDPTRTPAPDVTLGEGETRQLDLDVDVAPAGAVTGTVTINGRAECEALVVLRPDDPATGGVALRAVTDDAGAFRFDDVPAGSHTATVYGPGRQPLLQQEVAVVAGTTAALPFDLQAGGLRGQVLAADGSAPDELAGTLWVLPGADAAPDDLYAYRREALTQRVRVRRGAFEGDGLSAGPALLVLELRGRARTTTKVTIPPGGMMSIDLEAGAPQ